MRRATRVAAALALTPITGLAATASATTASAGAAPTGVTFTGHGFGHGRGMGQYGAYGYARAGQSAAQILAHFYGGTTLTGTDADRAGQPVEVRLDELDGATATTATGSGLTASWSGGSATGSPLTISRSPGGGLTVNGQAASGDVALSASGAVRLSLPGGAARSYLGTITVQAGAAVVIDTLALDDYVRGVVPAESPASWGADGEAALQAQAVAARSYALARIAARGGAPLFDTGTDQTYDGYQDDQLNPTYSAATLRYSDPAVSATAGQVLLLPSGAVALAEFSSSTGGYSAGGTFPAVVDDGDATPSNAYHDWTRTVAASDIQAAWPSIGTLRGVAVTARNGLGDMGGRATRVAVTGSSGAVDVTGDDVAAALGLPSDWFTPTAAGQSGPGGGGLDGYWILTSDGAVHPFGGATNLGSVAGTVLAAPVVAMAPTADQRGYWEVAGDGGIFSYGDATFYGSTGATRLNRPVIGMAPTPTGHGYWLFAGDGGIFSFGDARYFGSTGATHLNQPVVGMAATADGGGYWLVAADGGIFSFGDAAFHGSTGAMRLNQPIAGMVPTPDGAGYTLVAGDGGIFCFGSATFVGSLPGEGVRDTVAAVTPTPDGGGYDILGVSGVVHPFGDAPFVGDLRGAHTLDIFGHRG